ncbi:STAS domain-containing protein [Dactylosporangium sp. McL0621]|uniref:STAS domain-containing protein n=1 Tax=Dactylosporangium sp. McL0621 TaxID=3415678 RepID=UPI003CEB8A09
MTRMAGVRIDASCPSPGTVRVAVVGEIDLATAPVLHDALLNALSAQEPELLDVDLARVAFMDCIGVTVFIAVRRTAAGSGCRLQVTNPQPTVRHVLELTGQVDVLTARIDRSLPAPTTSAPASRTDPPPPAATQPHAFLGAA